MSTNTHDINQSQDTKGLYTLELEEDLRYLIHPTRSHMAKSTSTSYHMAVREECGNIARAKRGMI